MIPCQRDLFDIPEGVTYLNCAYMSPMMRAVAHEGRAGLERKMQPWKIRPADFFTQSEELRACAARFFLCPADDIAIVPSASYGIQMAAGNLPLAPGKKILVLEEQFPSNFYPWQRLARRNSGVLRTRYRSGARSHAVAGCVPFRCECGTAGFRRGRRL